MTLDAVGGVWSYALDTAAMLAGAGMTCRLLGFGPRPALPAAVIPGVEVIWIDEPLDWMVADDQALRGTAAAISAHAQAWEADLLHLAAATQAVGLNTGAAIVVQSHSCLPTWWAAMSDEPLPPEWQWQQHRNDAGFRLADGVIAPSASHGQALERIYGPIPNLRIVPNAVPVEAGHDLGKLAYVFAAGRWWDEGKNGQLLDQAAATSFWPIMMAGDLAGPNGATLTLSNAIAVGPLSRAETHIHMTRAAIFAAPSRYEPFGLAVLEAASRSAVLLLADIPVFRELWDGAAFFADPMNPVAWTAAIRLLATDPAQRIALGERARVRAGEFTFENQRTALLSAYAAVMDHHRLVERL